MADDATVEVRITGDASGADAAINQARQGVDGLRDRMDSLGGTLDGIKDQFTTAFQVTGIAAAGEALNKVSEILKGFAADAVEIRNMSELLGVTVEQFQGLKLAAEEAGVSMQIMFRSLERINVLLNAAREGSGAAEEKLIALGVSVEHINDPATSFNTILLELKERLNNASTSQATMNEMVKIFGGRAAQAVEAVKAYEGEAKQVNALHDAQIQQWVKLHGALSRYGELLGNTASKLAVFIAGDNALNTKLLEMTRNSDLAAWALGKLGINLRESHQLAPYVAEDTAKIATVTLQEVQALKASAEAARSGSTEKIAALRRYIAAAKEYFGKSDVDEIRAANKQMEISERELSDKRLAFLESWAAEYAHVTSSNVRNKLEADAKLNQEQNADAAKEKKQLEELANYAEQLDLRVSKEHARSLREMVRLQGEAAREIRNDYTQMASAFSSSLLSMLHGQQSFTQSMRSLFGSLADSFIQSQARGLAAGGITALKKITNDAYQAASGAYQALVGIPYVGPFIAPAGAAAAFVAVEAFGSGIATASRGYDIPSGINPMTQLHQREMVLPAAIADPLRGSLDKGGGLGGSTINLHLSAIDTQSVSGMLRNQKGTIAKALRDHARRR